MLSGETDRAPGDYGFDPLNYKKQKVNLLSAPAEIASPAQHTRETTRRRVAPHHTAPSRAPHLSINPCPLTLTATPSPNPHQDYSTVEVTHCRAAMLAFSGLVTQSAMFETGFPYVPHA